MQNLNAKVEALAAENSALKDVFGPGEAVVNFLAVALRHTNYDNIDLSDVSLAFKMSLPETPDTDAVIADMRDTARNELYQEFVKQARLAGLSDSDTVSVFEATDALLHCLEQLRSGKGEAS